MTTSNILNLHWRAGRVCALLMAIGWLASPVRAQTPAPAPASTPAAWQACAGVADAQARLNCFDLWAQQQLAPPSQAATSGIPPASALAHPAPVPVTPALVAGAEDGCRDDRHSPLSRFWELERATDCGLFELRGYRPISMSVVTADTVNRQPSSPAPGHTALTAEDYRTTETRIQLSGRIKVAKNIFTGAQMQRTDSLWIGFSQQSYWQFFTPRLSRPFRTTDYEPEAIYIYPTDLALPGGWRMRYTGAGLVHQSNGRSLPQSRSWNRGYLMTGLELGERVSVEARVWKRVVEDEQDDNPDISNFMGRGDLTATWHRDPANTFSATLRHSLRSSGHGAVRLEYFRALGKGTRLGLGNDLRLHAQFFSGYGDTLLDYNRKRNVLSLGLALVDW